MGKIKWKPGNMIYPLPAVMISCGITKDEYNIITISWTGTINTEPAMCYISVRKERHSYNIIKKNKEFIINLTTAELTYAADWCGVKSGKNYNKFKETGLTPEKASILKTPMIKESPVNIECKVEKIIELGSHDMFIAKILAVNVDEKYLDKNTGVFDLRQTEPVSYIHGNYYKPGNKIGRFGFSVKKKEKINKN